MARPSDNSLKYFNRDTKDDDNLLYVEAVHGLVGFAVVEKLWQHIFGGPGGYYCEWNEINQRLFCKKNGISLETLNDILETCFLNEIKIFSRSMYEEKKILTSTGIQKRWLKIVTEAGRKNNTIKEDFLLIGIETPPLLGFPPGETTPPVGLSAPETTQSKPKKNKVNEIKIGIRAIAAASPGETGSKSVLSDRNNTKKYEIPSSVQQVEAVFNLKMKHRWDTGFIALQANKFYNHYSANGWVQGRGKRIVSWKHAVTNWILNALEGSYTHKYFSSKGIQENGSSRIIPAADEFPPQETKMPMELPNDDKDRLSRQFIEEVFQSYALGEISETEVPGSIYNFLNRAGMLTLSYEEKARIRSAANGDEYESKRMAVIDYFNSLKSTGIKNVFM